MRQHEMSAERSLIRVALMAWVLTSILVVLIVFDPKAAAAMSPLQAHGALQRDHSIGIVSHRGAAGLAPENTIAAFEAAIAQGADFVETDVQLTSDGVPVLMHDPDVDRTTNGHGALAEHTFEQIRSLDAGSWFSPEFALERVPTFDEFLALLDTAPARAFVEIKGEWPAEQVAQLVETLREHQMVHRLVLASFEHETLEAVRQLAPEYATILLTRELDQATVDYALELQVSAVCARLKLLAANEQALAQLRSAGIGTIAYTLNKKKQWSKAKKIGVDFYVTDNPVALAEWRD